MTKLEQGDADGGSEGQSGFERQDRGEGLRRRILDAALPDVAFDGWTEAALRAGAVRAGLAPSAADLAFPRGGVDAAMFLHREGDRALAERLRAADLEGMRIRDRIVYAVRLRLEIAAPHREAVRRAASLFALPLYAADGARMMWETADAIWTALGDPSEDLNWYTKRAILAGVYSATALHWLGDDSPHFADSWAFLGRRIDGVMRFEKMKAMMRKNPLGRVLSAGPSWLASRIRKPTERRCAPDAPSDLPG